VTVTVRVLWFCMCGIRTVLA